MATDQKERAPGSDEDSRVPGQYAQRLAPHSTKSGGSAGGLYNPGGDSKAGGPGRQGGTDKTGATATGASFQPRNTTERLAGAVAPEATALVSAAQQLKERFTGTADRRRNTLIGTTGVVVILTIILGIAAILPDELISLMTDLEQHFFAEVDHDVAKESDKLVSRYIQNRILKRLGPECKDSGDLAKCASMKDRPGGDEDTATDDPIEGKDGLFDAWDNSDLAGQFRRQGVTFSEEGGRFFMNHPDLPGGKYDITKFATTEGSDLFEDPTLIKSGFAETLENAKEAMVVSRGSYLHKILTQLIGDGGRWCFADCDPGNEEKDRANLTPEEEDQAASAADETTLDATATAESDALSCLTDTTCDPTSREPQTTADDPGTSDPTAPDGDLPKSQFEETLASDLLNLVPFDVKNIKDLLKTFGDLKAKGTEAVADAIADAIGKVTGADVTGEAVTGILEKFSIVGWVQLAAQLISFIGTANVKVAAFTSKIHEVMSVHEMMIGASGAAEQKSGYNHTQINMLGSENTSLHAGGKNAEASPFVEQAVDPEHNKDITHDDVHSYMEKGHFSFDGNSNALTKLSDLANKIPGFNWLSDLAGLINKIVGLALGPLNFLISKLFGLTGINKLLALAIGPLLQAAVHYLFPLPNLTALSGEDKGTIMAAGTDSAGSQAAQAVGGKAVTGTVDGMIVNEQQTAEYQQFRARPFFARMFSADTPYSFASQLAMDMPDNSFSDTVRGSFAALLENPFGKIFGGLASVLQPTSAFAADNTVSNSTVDDAGITKNAIPDNDPVFANTPAGDPETYWKNNNCAQQAAQGWPQWNAATTLSTDNGELEHTTTNGCLLIERSVQAAGTLAGYGGGN